MNSSPIGLKDDCFAFFNCLLSTCELRWSSNEIPIPLCVEGRPYVAGLELNLQEHSRRQLAGLEAVTSTGLLHALWELPYGVPFPTQSFNVLDRATLESAEDGWVEKQDDTFVRLYQPVGTIRSIIVSDRSLARAVAKAASHSPTIRRFAIWRTSTTGKSPNAVETLLRARMLGVGVIAVDDAQFVELVAPAEAIRSRPVVFRWWQAELAYRNWISSTAPIESAVASV